MICPSVSRVSRLGSCTSTTDIITHDTLCCLGMLQRSYEVYSSQTIILQQNHCFICIVTVIYVGTEYGTFQSSQGVPKMKMLSRLRLLPVHKVFLVCLAHGALSLFHYALVNAPSNIAQHSFVFSNFFTGGLDQGQVFAELVSLHLVLRSSSIKVFEEIIIWQNRQTAVADSVIQVRRHFSCNARLQFLELLPIHSNSAHIFLACICQMLQNLALA